MATLISKATGNFTDANTWAVVDTTTFLDNETVSTALTTSFAQTGNLAPGAITIDGIACKLSPTAALNIGNGTATLSMELFNQTTSTSIVTVTLAATDLPANVNNTAYPRGWILFKFASTLLVAAQNYRIGLKVSAAGGTGLTISFCSTSGSNWNRMFRTTTTQAPASGNQLHIIGEHTGSGTGNSFTVTMDNTATTSFGTVTSVTQGITVGNRGTLTFGTTASTNYYLKFRGIFAVYDGGTLNVGTSGTGIPSTSTAVLEMMEPIKYALSAKPCAQSMLTN